MIDKNICNKVLTIGPAFTPPNGGIAQVMDYYNQFVFTEFHFVANSCPGSKLKKLWCAISAVFKTIFILIFSNSVEIVHIHTASKISFKRSVIFEKIGLAFKKKVVMHIHAGSFMDYYGTCPEYVAKNLKKCTKVIALTEGWKSRFENEIGLTNVEVINNIVPVPQDALDKADEDPIVHGIFLGAIKWQKGIFDLLDVIADNKQFLQGKFMLHIGGNEQVDLLKEKIETQKLSDIVKYEGWVNDKQKTDLLQQSKIMFLPSYIEGLPICILEAMSYGLCIISSNVGGIPDIVKNEENGFTFEPGDKAKLCSSLLFFVENPDRIAPFGQKSRELVKDYFPENVSSQINSFYVKLLNE